MEYVLHNFIKYFPSARVNYSSNKCLNGCLVFAIFGSIQKMLTKHLLNKEINHVGNHR